MQNGNCVLTGTITWEGQQESDREWQHVMYKLGTVVARPPESADASADASAVAATDTALPIQSVECNETGIASNINLTVDAALFPFLHPYGKGGFRSGESLTNMLRQRVQQLFSPFTLIKEYLLVMFQVR